MDKKKFPQVDVFEEDIEEPELDLDFDYALVEVADGILISSDDDVVKLLFYHVKPSENGDNHRCKAIIEFRVSRKRFLDMAYKINETCCLLESQSNVVSNPMYN